MKNHLLFFVSLFSIQFVMSQNIPKDAVLFQQRSYKVYEVTCTWHEAVAQCKALGGTLVSINNKEEDVFVFQLAAGRCLWLGASDEITEGEWLWQDGTKVTYKNWAPQEPDNWKGKEDWSVIGWPAPRFKNGGWGDTVADKRMQIVGFICEWE